jgi:protein TonB
MNSAAVDKLPGIPRRNRKHTYVGRNFNSPDIATDSNIKYTFFVVEKDGSMTDIQVKNDPGYGLGKEAIRVLKSLKQNGLQV